MNTSIEEQLRRYSEWSEEQVVQVTATEAANSSHDMQESPVVGRTRRLDRRLLLPAASIVLVVVGVAGLTFSTRSAVGPVASQPSTASEQPAPSASVASDGMLVASAVPDDLVYRGVTVTALLAEVAPLVYMWSPDATVRFDLGDPRFAEDIPRPDNVAEAIRESSFDDGETVVWSWTNEDDQILVVVADNADLDTVAPLARRFDELNSAGSSFDLLQAPEGFETFDASTLEPTSEYRWISNDQSRGLSITTTSMLPLSPRALLDDDAIEIEQSATLTTTIRSFGLDAIELDNIESGLQVAESVSLPPATPLPAPPVKTDPEPQVFATEVSPSPLWTIEGRVAGKNTPTSGIAEVRNEQHGYHLDPFQLLDLAVLPVGDQAVLVAYTADGVKSARIEWLDNTGAVVNQERTGQHLTSMLEAGYPPLIAATVPTGATSVRLTPESAEQQAMISPLLLDDLTAVDPPD